MFSPAERRVVEFNNYYYISRFVISLNLTLSPQWRRRVKKLRANTVVLIQNLITTSQQSHRNYRKNVVVLYYR